MFPSQSYNKCIIYFNGRIRWSLTSTLSTYWTEIGYEAWHPRDGRSGVWRLYLTVESRGIPPTLLLLHEPHLHHSHTLCLKSTLVTIVRVFPFFRHLAVNYTNLEILYWYMYNIFFLLIDVFISHLLYQSLRCVDWQNCHNFCKKHYQKDKINMHAKAKET